MIEELKDDKFDLERNSYLTIGSVAPNCLGFLPSKSMQSNELLKQNQSKKNTESLVVGCSRGYLYLVDFESFTPKVTIKSDQMKSEITCMDFHLMPEELIFYSYGNSIYVTNRSIKKELSKIEFNIPDKIFNFKVRNNMVWTANNNFINCYQFGKFTQELYYNDVDNNVSNFLVSDAYGTTHPIILAGTSNKIKIFRKDAQLHNIPLSSAPSSFLTYKAFDNDLKENNIMFGTTFGSNGLLVLGENENTDPKILWERSSNIVQSEVIAMRNFDINTDCSNEVILIRENGELNVISVGNTLFDHIQISNYLTNEVLTGMEIGNFMREYEKEIVLSSLSGLVFSLTPNAGKNNAPTQKQVLDKETINSSLKNLKDEISELNMHLKKKREEKEIVQNSNQIFNEKGEKNTQLIVTKNPYKTSFKLTLQAEESLYDLVLESEYPLDVIVFQAQISINIIDVLSNDVSLNIIINNENEFLATLRLKGNIHSVHLKIRTPDGKKDNLKCTLIPLNIPKTAYILEVPIKALPLYERLDEDGDLYQQGCIRDFKSIEEKYINKITVSGSFSTYEINQILSELIPDIPEKTSKEKLRYYMKDSFLNTVILIEIENNSCIMKSINFAPLMIIKEQISQIANIRRKNIESQAKLELASMFKLLQNLNPLIQRNFELESEHKLIEAFKEIDVNSVTQLPKKYQEILQVKENIEKQYKRRKINLDFMKSIVLNLLKYVSKVTQVLNYKEKIENIEEIMKNYNVEKMVIAFKNFTTK